MAQQSTNPTVATTAGTPASGEEVLERLAEQQYEPDRPQSTVWRFLRDTVVVAVLLAGGVYLYKGYIDKKEQIAKLGEKGARLLESDDFKSLQSAEATYKEILELDPQHPHALASIAETYFHLDRHGANKLAESERYLALAVEAGSKAPERYATSAYIQIRKGETAFAVTEISDLLSQNLYSPKLAHALGWALLEQRQFSRASQTLRKAMETRSNSIRFLLSVADGLHRQGKERSALRSLDRVLARSMNPEHGIALGWAAALRAKNYGNLEKTAKYLDTLGKIDKRISPAAKAYKAWAEGELALALQNPAGAIEKADAAEKVLKGYAPLYHLRARAHRAAGRIPQAIAELERQQSHKRAYLGNGWLLAELRGTQADDGALASIDELESEEMKELRGYYPDKNEEYIRAQLGPEYEIFRGEHYLRLGKIDEAEAAFKRAANQGADAEILLGIANVTFQKQKARGKKADLEAVGEAFSDALEARAVFPQLQESLANVNLWNYQVEAASKALTDAEDQYKKLRRPVPELVAFFDRAIATFQGADDKKIKRASKKAVGAWQQRKASYIASVAAFQN